MKKKKLESKPSYEELVMQFAEIYSPGSPADVATVDFLIILAMSRMAGTTAPLRVLLEKLVKYNEGVGDTKRIQILREFLGM